MYHTRHKRTHYEADYKWGNFLFHSGNVVEKGIKRRKILLSIFLTIYLAFYFTMMINCI